MITQQRIRDLITYIQLTSGDPSYVNPASIYVAIDSDNFGAKPLRYPLLSLVGAEADSDAGTITGIASATVVHTFDTPFATVPVCSLFNAYRYTEVEPGKFVRNTVQTYVSGSNWITTNDFTVTIESTESLTGVIIDFKFEAV